MKKLLQILRARFPSKNLRQALLLLLFTLAFQSELHASQLPDFTLNVIKTDENCLGNGTLTFSVEGVDPLATVEYQIYQLPDLVNAIAIQTDNFLGGRTSGTYHIVATQTLNGESNSQSQDITINNAIVPLTYTLASTNALCGNDASLSVTITSGTGAFYEIISGPVIRTPQTSPVFNLIPAGVYGVRVFDDCGVGWVTTHTIISDAAQIAISDVAFPHAELPACDSITVSNTLTPSLNHILTYPINVEYTIFPPNNGPPITITQVFDFGESNSKDLETNIPFYYDQPYTYTIAVTDHCGNVFTHNNAINEKFHILVTAEIAKCGQHFLKVRAINYRPPLTITFLEVPGGFDPVAFNSGHPGPFNTGEVNYGSYDVPVPLGHYVVSVTDGCGRTAQNETTVEYHEAHPNATIEPYPGCQSNTSLVEISINGFTIVSAQVTAAPAGYPNPLPDEVSQLVTVSYGLVLDHLITGNYTVHLVDDCGNIYDYDFFVPDTATSVTYATRNDCELGKGAIRLRGSSTILTSVIMTAAPAAFAATFPYDVSFDLTPDGIFSMAGLPPGNYGFDVIDNCGLAHSLTVSLAGYAISTNNLVLTPHCGSFDFTLTYTSTANGQESFWLQKFNPATNTWGHPETGVPYPEGTVPNASNSYPITANVTTLNLIFTGNFRIIKRFESFENGSVGQFKDCVETIDEFEYTGIFQITGFEKVTCNGAFADVKVLTNGVPPMTYKIIKKNGLPFFIDNGYNNVFTNLEQAVYTFQVQHSCGHIATGDADVAQLPSLSNAVQPDNLETCDDSSNDGEEEFDLSSQNAVILGSQNAADYTLTYHLSLSDATLGVNPLPDHYISGSHIIYARLKYTGSSTDCFDITSFQLIVDPYPVPDMKKTWALCEGNSVTITAAAGYDHYLWSTGQTTQSITVSQAGQYTLQVTDGNCVGLFPIDVIPSNAATIEHIDISDWTENDNTITVILDSGSIGNYVYSIDGIHFQESNTFQNLPAGSYTVYVKDLNDCGIIDQDVFLLTYPKYFTPNGDGFHEFWKVKFSETEPHMMTYIFDRYGKLITGFLPDSPGWDGMYNGEPLPSTDYWFLVVRENGKEFRGHFSMKR